MEWSQLLINIDGNIISYFILLKPFGKVWLKEIGLIPLKSFHILKQNIHLIFDTAEWLKKLFMF